MVRARAGFKQIDQNATNQVAKRSTWETVAIKLLKGLGVDSLETKSARDLPQTKALFAARPNNTPLNQAA